MTYTLGKQKLCGPVPFTFVNKTTNKSDVRVSVDIG